MATDALEAGHADLPGMSNEQLLKTCNRLETNRQMMEVLVGELHNEKEKLMKHRGMLSERIERVGGTAAGLDSALRSRRRTTPSLSPAAAADAAAGGSAGAATAASALAPSRSPIRQMQSAAGTQLPQASVSEGPGGTSGIGRLPEGGSTLASQLGDQRMTSSDLSVPEELLLRQLAGGVVRLTWFYNEHVLEQLADPNHPLKHMSFEVRQQSEGTTGRLRARTHICECRGLDVGGSGEEVGEQSVDIEGCVAGKAYAFSVRARAEFTNQNNYVYSNFCEIATLGSFPTHLNVQVAPVEEAAAREEAEARQRAQTEDAASRREGSVQRHREEASRWEQEALRLEQEREKNEELGRREHAQLLEDEATRRDAKNAAEFQARQQEARRQQHVNNLHSEPPRSQDARVRERSLLTEEEAANRRRQHDRESCPPHLNFTGNGGFSAYNKSRIRGGLSPSRSPVVLRPKTANATPDRTPGGFQGHTPVGSRTPTEGTGPQKREPSNAPMDKWMNKILARGPPNVVLSNLDVRTKADAPVDQTTEANSERSQRSPLLRRGQPAGNTKAIPITNAAKASSTTPSKRGALADAGSAPRQVQHQQSPTHSQPQSQSQSQAQSQAQSQPRTPTASSKDDRLGEEPDRHAVVGAKARSSAQGAFPFQKPSTMRPTLGPGLSAAARGMRQAPQAGSTMASGGAGPALTEKSPPPRRASQSLPGGADNLRGIRGANEGSCTSAEVSRPQGGSVPPGSDPAGPRFPKRTAMPLAANRITPAQTPAHAIAPLTGSSRHIDTAAEARRQLAQAFPRCNTFDAHGSAPQRSSEGTSRVGSFVKPVPTASTGPGSAMPPRSSSFARQGAGQGPAFPSQNRPQATPTPPQRGQAGQPQSEAASLQASVGSGNTAASMAAPSGPPQDHSFGASLLLPSQERASGGIHKHQSPRDAGGSVAKGAAASKDNGYPNSLDVQHQPQPQREELQQQLQGLVSQRLNKATELQQQLLGRSARVSGSQNDAVQPPNMQNWGKVSQRDAVAGGATFHELPATGPGSSQDSPPLRSAAVSGGNVDNDTSQSLDSFQGMCAMQTIPQNLPGMPLGQTMQHLPPPPRRAPSLTEPTTPLTVGNLPHRRGSGPGEADASGQFMLKVLASDNKWETLTFSASEDLPRQGAAFLQSRGLKAAFRAGLTSKMQAMVAAGETRASVDIVDLI